MFLCDTNVISELARPEPDSGVLNWAMQTSFIALSVITVEEIFYGLAAKPNSRIQNWFEDFLGMHCRILDISPEIAQRAGELRGTLRNRGQTRTQADMLIAATAQVHQLTLVTRNTRDFDGCSLTVLNPFSR